MKSHRFLSVFCLSYVRCLFYVQFLFALSVLTAGMASAHEAVFQIMEYDNQAEEFILKQYGQVPQGSYVDFWNTFGYVSGNRYNQIPGNHNATLTLVGWGGCRIDSITLSMCSNNHAGNVRLTVVAGDSLLFTMPTTAFNSPSWYGEWLSKDCQVYGDITKPMQASVIPNDTSDIVITVSGGTTSGTSVYLHRITVYYTIQNEIDPSLPAVPLVSPFGYVYEKLEKKAVLHDLDTVILYRSGYAACDLGGIASSHYLDAAILPSYMDVSQPWVSHFVLHKDGTNWRLIDLYGDTLCAKGLKNLAWNDGVSTWTISLTYDGAEIASTNANYGMLRHNAPSSSYPRFWNYASSSNLSLPYLYRRLRQNQPIAPTSISLPASLLIAIDTTSSPSSLPVATSRPVATSAPSSLPTTSAAVSAPRELAVLDTLVLRPSLLPAKVTDERVRWTSSNPTVASVRDGVVYLHAVGQTLITCTIWDGLLQATCSLTVISAVPDALENIDVPSVYPYSNSSIIPSPGSFGDSSSPAIKFFDSGHLFILRSNHLYAPSGVLLR